MRNLAFWTLTASLCSTLVSTRVARAETPPSHYHPDDIAAASKVFAGAAEVVGPRYAQSEKELKQVGGGLEYLELGVFLLGESAPAGISDWMDSIRRQATGEWMRLQKHVDLMGEDYSTEFGAAMERVLGRYGKGQLVECGASGIAAMVGRKDCPGKDMNGEIAGQIDKDPALQKAVQSIADVPWPAVSHPSQQWPVVPVTGSENWVQIGALMRTLFPARVELHQDNLDRALEPLEDGLAAGDQGALTKAAQHRADYYAALAADGAVIAAALRASLEKGAKKGAPAAVGLCANPPSLGGCAGKDVTRETLQFLQADAKFEKATATLR